MVPEDIIEIWVLAIQQANRTVVSQRAVARAEVPQQIQQMMQEMEGLDHVNLPDELMPATADEIENEFTRSFRRATELFDQDEQVTSEEAQNEVAALEAVWDIIPDADTPND